MRPCDFYVWFGNGQLILEKMFLNPTLMREIARHERSTKENQSNSRSKIERIRWPVSLSTLLLYLFQ